MIKPRGKEREKYDFEKNIYFPLLRSADSVFSLCCSARQSHKLLLRPPGFSPPVDWFFLSSFNNVARILSFFLTAPSLFAALHAATLAFYFYFCIPQLLLSPPHWTHGQKQMGKHCRKRKKKRPEKTIATCALLFLGRCMSYN